MNSRLLKRLGGCLYVFTLLPGALFVAADEAEENEAYPVSITLKEEDAISTTETLSENFLEDIDAVAPVPLSIELVAENRLAAADEGPYPVQFEADAEDGDPAYPTFSDLPMLRNISVPDWFKNTFLDLPDDLDHAVEAGKLGLIVYFGQRHCAYCEAMQKTVFTRPDLQAYMDRYFDVLAIDVWGKLEVTDMQGKKTNETQFANAQAAYFTPSLIFYNALGEEALRLRGYYPPHVIRAALDYVVSNNYQQESFRDYQARSTPPDRLQDSQKLQPNPLFMPPPYVLDRHAAAASRPLLVLFEQPQCHACNLFHGDLLTDSVIQKNLQSFDIVQLNIMEETPLITPRGDKISARPRQWAEQQGIFYTPSLLFFDLQGREIFRVESVIQHIRLNQVLKYILSQGYQSTPIFERWISRQLTLEAG